ncbi:septum formation initiator family protein, partial [Streptomyces sp. NPDC127079]
MSRKPELRGRAARLARLFPAGRGPPAARTPFVLPVSY